MKKTQRICGLCKDPECSGFGCPMKGSPMHTLRRTVLENEVDAVVQAMEDQGATVISIVVTTGIDKRARKREDRFLTDLWHVFCRYRYDTSPRKIDAAIKALKK